MTRNLARMIAALRLRLAWRAAQVRVLLQPEAPPCPSCNGRRHVVLARGAAGEVITLLRCAGCHKVAGQVVS